MKIYGKFWRFLPKLIRRVFLKFPQGFYLKLVWWQLKILRGFEVSARIFSRIHPKDVCTWFFDGFFHIFLNPSPQNVIRGFLLEFLGQHLSSPKCSLEIASKNVVIVPKSPKVLNTFKDSFRSSSEYFIIYLHWGFLRMFLRRHR